MLAVGKAINKIIQTCNATLNHDVTTPPQRQRAIADTGCTGHFLPIAAANDSYTPTDNGLTVQLPNGEQMRATKTGMLDLPTLPPQARVAHVFPQMTGRPLVSIGQLCDSGCTATFTNNKVIVSKDGNTILEGQQYNDNKLWSIDIHSQQETQ